MQILLVMGCCIVEPQPCGEINVIPASPYVSNLLLWVVGEHDDSQMNHENIVQDKQIEIKTKGLTSKINTSNLEMYKTYKPMFLGTSIILTYSLVAYKSSVFISHSRTFPWPYCKADCPIGKDLSLDEGYTRNDLCERKCSQHIGFLQGHVVL
jgi:hypothetical protein